MISGLGGRRLWEAAQELRAEVGGEGPYRSASLLAEKRDASVRVQLFPPQRGDRQRVKESLLIPRERGFLILVNGSPLGLDGAEGGELLVWQRRWIRFRVAHEIGHTYFYAGAPARRADEPDAVEESLCDRFGGLLLVGDMSDAAVDGIRGVVARARLADVSLQVCAHVFLDGLRSGWWPSPPGLPGGSWVVAGLSRRPNPGTGRDVDWRFDWGVGSFVPRHARAGGKVIGLASRFGYAQGPDELRVRLGQGYCPFVAAQRYRDRIVAVFIDVARAEGPTSYGAADGLVDT